MLGHMTCAARFPCSLCLAHKDSLENPAEIRTMQSIQIDANDQCHPHSYREMPLLPVLLEHVIIPSFHCLHGIAMKALKALEHLADKNKFDEFCASKNAKKDARKQNFTG